MPDIVIEAKNISKKYVIYHEHQELYATLTGTLAAYFRKFYQRIRHPLTKQKSTTDAEEFWALQDINLSVSAGDRVGIIGRNGAGKSTLLKLFSRITAPTTGYIKIKGRIASLLEIGTGFHPELTGRENIFLNGAILGMTRQEIKQKFDEIVAFSEVEKFLDTPMKRFSSGMLTRLGFAVAAHLDPDILIADEVLAVGDAQFQEKCLKKLNDLGNHGRTILFVSHDIGSVVSLCNKGVFLDKGKITYQGPIDECVNAYMRTCRFHNLSWEGDEGDEHIRFYRASLSMNQHNREFFYQDDKAHLEMEYEVLAPTNDLVLGIGVWNQRNQLLARSQTADDLENFSSYIKPGRHRLLFTVDASLFLEGEYLIKLDCYIHNKKRILNDEVSLKFPVYSRKKNQQLSHSGMKEGVFLGNNWKRFTPV